MIPIKTEEQLAIQRRVGNSLSLILKSICQRVKPGMTTAQVDKIAEVLIFEYKAKPAFKGYRGFPACICASVNNEVVHGIPNDRILLEGDILSIDIGIESEGFFADMAITIPVGEISKELRKLIEITKKSLDIGIKEAVVGKHLQDISFAIQNFVEANGYSVVRQYVGHGIGKALHEEPEVPNFGRRGYGAELRNGMVLAIEPMVNMGSWQTRLLDNGWTAVTSDGKHSAHFEHTVAVVESTPQILTI